MATDLRAHDSVPLQASAVGANRLCQLLLASLGVTFVGIGLVGVFLPGIPTTGPLLVASYLLAKSNPQWERRLLGLPIFRRYVRCWDGSRQIPLRARLWALVGMWASIAGSCLILNFSTPPRTTIVMGTLGLGLIGTAAICLVRRSGRTARPATGRQHDFPANGRVPSFD